MKTEIEILLEKIKQFEVSFELQDHLRQFDQYRKIHEVLELQTVAYPMQEMLDRFNSLSVASNAQKLMEQYFPKYHLGVSEEAWPGAMQMKAINDAAKQYAEYLKPISQQQEWLELQLQAFAGIPDLDFVRELNAVAPSLSVINAVRTSLDRLWPAFQSMDFSQYFDVSEDDKQELERAAQVITHAAAEQQSIQDAVQEIVAAIHAQQKPTVQLMLWLFFLKVMDWLIAGAIGAVMGHYTPAVLGESPQEAKKVVQDMARLAVGAPELLLEYRYVSATVLLVRQNPKARSPEIGRLKFGKAVKLLKKDKDFALIHWADQESGAELQGWVFARYLGRFN